MIAGGGPGGVKNASCLSGLGVPSIHHTARDASPHRKVTLTVFRARKIGYSRGLSAFGGAFRRCCWLRPALWVLTGVARLTSVWGQENSAGQPGTDGNPIPRQTSHGFKIFSSLKRNSVSSVNPVLLTHSPVNTTLS
jgi:hypothetical protein